MDRIFVILEKYDTSASSVSALGPYVYHNIQTCLLVYIADPR